MKRILIIGGSGFIGKNLKEYLESKYTHEYVIDAPSSRDLDITNEISVSNYLKNNFFHTVFHFGYYTNYRHPDRDSSKILEYNLRSFELFCKYESSYGRMFYSGSGAEYDKSTDIINVNEEACGKCIPKDEYGLLKYIIGQRIEQSSNIYNLRVFGLFGKYEYYPAKFISGLCAKAVYNLPLTIRQDLYFDYLYIDDFCRMVDIMMHAKHLDHHTYNIVSGKKVSLYELSVMVNEISAKSLPIVLCKEGLGLEYTASNERFKREFPDFEYTKIRDAVESLYNWFCDNKQDINLYKLIYE